MTASGAVVSHGLDRLGWTTIDLWVAAIGIGGSLGRRDIAAIADGSRTATPIEHDILVAALNDAFTDGGQDHPLLYWDEGPGRQGT
jgi:hypothetical protein